MALTSKRKEQFPWGSLSGRTPQSSLGSSRPALAEYNPGCLSVSLLLPHLLTSVSARIPPITGDRRLLCLPLRILPYPEPSYSCKILSFAIHDRLVLLPHSDETKKINTTATRKPFFSLGSNTGCSLPWHQDARMHAKSLQLCWSLCDPVDCSLPDSSVHGILQARTLEWVAIPFSRGSSRPMEPKSLVIPATAGGFVITSAT